MGKQHRGGKRGSGGAGGPTYKGELTLSDGSKIEFDGDLKYGKKDGALSQVQRKNIEAWEKKRVKNKIEYAYSVDENGNQIGKEIRGGKGSVYTPSSMHGKGAVFTHNHPREAGVLGGTFSDADLYTFAKRESKTTRATAKEGTYSISKTSNFNAEGFKSFVRKANKNFRLNYDSLLSDAGYNSSKNNTSYSDYVKDCNKAFNTALIGLHNEYMKGQKQYGYTYTLEK